MSTVTDSAAAASAWSCGEKFYNGSICWRVNDPTVADYPLTVLEEARNRDMATGLVATSTITHATPAAFGSHIHVRKCENEIARQYIQETGVDVILGGGVSTFNGSSGADPSYSCPPAGNWITEAESDDYAVVYTADEMNAAVADGTAKLLGLFAGGGLTPEVSRTEDSTEPHLAQMTATALDILEKDKDGFFLLVEGSQIDWAGHANDIDYLIGEMVAFDDAVKEVLDWIAEKPARAHSTLLIIVGDHETGGFGINGPYGTLSEAGDMIEAGWTSGGHTAVDTLIWSQGPQAERLARPLDNTDLYRAMMDALR
jgi:alkaline phosphatase